MILLLKLSWNCSVYLKLKTGNIFIKDDFLLLWLSLVYKTIYTTFFCGGGGILFKLDSILSWEPSFLQLLALDLNITILATVVGDFINIIKTTFDFNFDLYSAFKQLGYTKTWKQKEAVNLKSSTLITCKLVIRKKLVNN